MPSAPWMMIAILVGLAAAHICGAHLRIAYHILKRVAYPRTNSWLSGDCQCWRGQPRSTSAGKSVYWPREPVKKRLEIIRFFRQVLSTQHKCDIIGASRLVATEGVCSTGISLTSYRFLSISSPNTLQEHAVRSNSFRVSLPNSYLEAHIAH
jgi:hypothetical protein